MDSLCIPLVSHSETLGMLNLQADANVSSGNHNFTEEQQRLALTLADQIALSLANLNLKEMLQRQAIRDGLTGLYNRRYMEESLERELQKATRDGSRVAVFMLDIDHFKNFNDTYGHAAGDALLIKLGERLRNFIRGGDIACRYGGEEFTLILPDTLPDVAYERAEQLRRIVKELEVTHRGQRLGAIAISIGVATFPEHGSTAELLLRSADAALYSAKREGRDRVVMVTIS